MEDDEESLFRRLEGWYVENDLHIWYGVVSFIALFVMVFIIEREANMSLRMKDQIALLQIDLVNSHTQIMDLRAENEKQRNQFMLPVITPAHEGVDKTATKVNDKISKVQDIIIDKALNQPTKVKTETVTTTVEVKTVVNKELNTMMKDSYCATVPSAKECKE